MKAVLKGLGQPKTYNSHTRVFENVYILHKTKKIDTRKKKEKKDHTKQRVKL